MHSSLTSDSTSQALVGQIYKPHAHHALCAVKLYSCHCHHIPVLSCSGEVAGRRESPSFVKFIDDVKNLIIHLSRQLMVVKLQSFVCIYYFGI